MKRIAITMLILLALLALCGCSTGKVDAKMVTERELDNKMFMTVSNEYCGRIIVDKSSRVMYWMSFDTNNYGNLTLIVNPDGTPRIWEG